MDETKGAAPRGPLIFSELLTQPNLHITYEEAIRYLPHKPKGFMDRVRDLTMHHAGRIRDQIEHAGDRTPHTREACDEFLQIIGKLVLERRILDKAWLGTFAKPAQALVRFWHQDKPQLLRDLRDRRDDLKTTYSDVPGADAWAHALEAARAADRILARAQTLIDKWHTMDWCRELLHTAPEVDLPLPVHADLFWTPKWRTQLNHITRELVRRAGTKVRMSDGHATQAVRIQRDEDLYIVEERDRHDHVQVERGDTHFRPVNWHPLGTSGTTTTIELLPAHDDMDWIFVLGQWVPRVAVVPPDPKLAQKDPRFEQALAQARKQAQRRRPHRPHRATLQQIQSAEATLAADPNLATRRAHYKFDVVERKAREAKEAEDEKRADDNLDAQQGDADYARRLARQDEEPVPPRARNNVLRVVAMDNPARRPPAAMAGLAAQAANAGRAAGLIVTPYQAYVLARRMFRGREAFGLYTMSTEAGWRNHIFPVLDRVVRDAQRRRQ